MIQSYEVLEHTADLKIKVYGRNLPELFSNALKGMFESVVSCQLPVVSKELPIKRKIKLKSPDLETLLVDFLSEALYLSDVNDEAYFEAFFDKLTKTELIGIVKGKKAREFKEEIKAVTFHGLKVEEIEGRWEAIILFDI